MAYRLAQLQECRPLTARPVFIPRARLRGVKLKGLTYERRVGKSLKAIWSHVRSGVWFEYRDSDGQPRWCQPDHFVPLAKTVILFECKLSEKEEAWQQMRCLYAPILEMHYQLPVTCVQVCRFLRTGNGLILDPRQALEWPGGDFLWHHLG